MFEKVNPSHPDKVADRIAGAIVDLAYTKESDPRIAVEVLVGHNLCTVIAETSVTLDRSEVLSIVKRLTDDKMELNYLEVAQDIHLSGNQSGKIRCGDNGIFKGVPLTDEQKTLSFIASHLYEVYGCDGKYIIDGDKLIICQSNVTAEELLDRYPGAIVNPLGFWTGGTNVDTGATNRKLGSDMADGVTGGGLHGKDLSKADVSVNIYAFLEAQKRGEPVSMCCAIGDETVNGVPYEEIVEIARNYIKRVGGFEKFAEWGLTNNDFTGTERVD